MRNLAIFFVKMLLALDFFVTFAHRINDNVSGRIRRWGSI